MNVRWLVGVAATALLVWFNSPELPWPARLAVTVLLAVLPALMIMQAQQLRHVDVLPRQAAYVSSIASLWILAGLVVAAALASRIPLHDIGFRTIALGPLMAWTLGLTAACTGVVLLFHAAGFRDPDVVRQLLPVTRRDGALFVGVSITAGVCEEVVFRGFLLHVLLTATGSLPLALLLSSGAFGVVHAYQAPMGAVRAGTLGALLALPLLLHGSLLPAILAHILIDLISGFWLARALYR